MQYDRETAVRYAGRWAHGRNPRFADFTRMGGDCANFISQCILAGWGRMDGRRDIGWYYRSLSDRAPAWSGARFLHEYLLRSGDKNRRGPMGEMCRVEQLQPGDVVFLRQEGRVYHSLLVLTGEPVLIAAHTTDSWQRPLMDYRFAEFLPVHILDEGGKAVRS